MNAGIVAAAGRDSPMGPNVDRAFLSLGTRPVLAYSIVALEKCPDIDMVIIVVRRDRIDAAQAVAQMFGCAKVKRVVAGGAQRSGSVQAGLDALSSEVRFVSVLDASRPCVTPDLISETLRQAKRYGSGVAAMRTEDSMKEVQKGLTVSRTVGRSHLWHSMTPQSYRVELLREGLKAARKKRLMLEDDAQAVELVDSVHLVPTTVPNIRIASADDLTLAAAVLRL